MMEAPDAKYLPDRGSEVRGLEVITDQGFFGGRVSVQLVFPLEVSS